MSRHLLKSTLTMDQLCTWSRGRLQLHQVLLVHKHRRVSVQAQVEQLVQPVHLELELELEQAQILSWPDQEVWEAWAECQAWEAWVAREVCQAWVEWAEWVDSQEWPQEVAQAAWVECLK